MSLLTLLFVVLLITGDSTGKFGMHPNYGQDAIREKNQALNHLRMSSRLDAYSSRIESAVRMNSGTSSMQGVVKGMDKSLKAMNPEQLSKLMDKFEQQFEDLDVKAEYMEGTMNAMTATSTPDALRHDQSK